MAASWARTFQGGQQAHHGPAADNPVSRGTADCPVRTLGISGGTQRRPLMPLLGLALPTHGIRTAFEEPVDEWAEQLASLQPEDVNASIPLQVVHQPFLLRRS